MKKICIILLVLLLVGWLILALVVGFDNYFDWCRHHKAVIWGIKIAELLLCIPIFINNTKS